MIRLLVIAVAVASLGAQERPLRSDYPRDGIYWEPSWKVAWSESINRGSPMMVAFLADGSDESKALAESVFADRKYIEYSRMWVNVVAHPGTGHEVEIERGGKRIPVCDRYWDIACGVHAKADQDVRVLKVPEARPAILLVNGEGKEIGRLAGPLKAADLVKAQDALLSSYYGYKTPAKEWRAAKLQVAEGEAFVKEAQWQKAIKVFTRVKESPLKGIQMLGDSAMGQVNMAGEQMFAEAYKMTMDKNKIEQGKRKLREIVEKFKPLNCAKKAEETLAALKSHGH